MLDAVPRILRMLASSFLAIACAGSPPGSQPSPVGEPDPPPASPTAAVELEPPSDASASIDQNPDAGSEAATPESADAGAADAKPITCSEAADYVPYVVDLGPNENSAAMGPREKSPSDEGRPIRAKLTALSAPKEFDAFNFATYLPHYVAQAYQEALVRRPGLRGSVTITLLLDESGKATKVTVQAPGFPASFVDEVRERADTTHVVCPPVPAPVKVRATITLAPRTIRVPGRR